jgi:acetyltransferase-like isoleucine patch superfamily enzyme
MHTDMFLKRFKNIVVNKILSPCYSQIKILKYQLLSTGTNIKGRPQYVCPVLIKGPGKIVFDKNVSIGVVLSPYFYSTYCYIEARYPDANIVIGANVYINNNACIISEGEGIYIAKNTIIGPNFTVFDSDFHHIDPSKRLIERPGTSKVEIGENVFIGANVTILKGVSIGNNTVIGSNSVISKSMPANSVAAGNPCKVIKEISH